MLRVGERVVAEWTSGDFYPGRVADVREGEPPLLFVAFDDGDTAWVALEKVASSAASRGLAPSPGTRVVGEWKTRDWYRGVLGEARGKRWLVHFDDGDERWLSLEKVLFLGAPLPLPAVGTRVMAEWTPGAYYAGTVTELKPGRAFVQFDDGDAGWVGVHRIGAATPGQPKRGRPCRFCKRDMSEEDEVCRVCGATR